MSAFVVQYNRRTRECRLAELPTAQEAIEYRLTREKQRTDTDLEICALSTTTLASLTRTHSRYFSSGYTLISAETGEDSSFHGPS